MSEREFWNAVAEARHAYSTGGIEGASSWLKRMFDAYDARDGAMQARIHAVFHPLCEEETPALLDGQAKNVTCIRERAHDGPHQGFFPDTTWTTPW